MTERPRQYILAREGWIHVAVVLLAAAAVQWWAGWVWALPLWLLVLFVVQFFRDPPRRIPDEPAAVISPADGRIIAVDEVHDPYLDRTARRISIFMNVFNVHANRIPVSGTVRQRWYHPGRFVNAALDKASSENERNALWIHADEDCEVVVVQVAGLIARRILCYAGEGDRVQRGERFGFIRFGSRVDIFLPAGSSIRVALGDRVAGGRDVLASLPH
ncbi:MAG: phosphatidylserine decarboxylase [Pseudomonadota bacterium]|nr:phosphatidylserine decarboxylase [Pseudomonadota bacterium]